MNSGAASRAPAVPAQLAETRAAFDSVAADYDGERGNNEAIRAMRAEMWRWLDATFAPGSRLLDLGCGTGLDAVRMARRGHQVTATDWSGAMVGRTRERARRERLEARLRTLQLGAHELERLDEPGGYDGAYSNLGALNCLPDPAALARECARLVRPGGALVFTVIGRFCPWEVAHYLWRGRWARVRVRFAPALVPVRLNGQTVWARYYFPRELYRSFSAAFRLEHHRALALLVPPPYLMHMRERHPRLYQRLWRAERRVAGWPLLRAAGDHFLMIMRRRAP